MMLVRIDKEKGVIFPSIIFIGTGLIFVVSEFHVFGPNVDLGMLWPFFIIMPGLAFVGLWVTDRKNWGVLVPAAACLVTGTIFLSMRFSESAHWLGYMMPGIVIIIGIVVLMGGFTRKKEENLTENKDNNIL
jgi:peptidoglycan/LPS O-acetylase OafA/YrhL